jgi:hypothetical protein
MSDLEFPRRMYTVMVFQSIDDSALATGVVKGFHNRPIMNGKQQRHVILKAHDANKKLSSPTRSYKLLAVDATLHSGLQEIVISDQVV